MLHLVSVALGGALGALARYGVGVWFYSADQRLPWHTLAVNVFGSFLMGICFVLIMERGRIPDELRPLLMTGFLGAFTTFSAFSLETFGLLHEGHVVTALFYVLLSVIL